MLVTSVRAAEGTERRPVRRASKPLPAEKPSRDTPVPPFRFVVRGGEWAVGGALRGALWLLARPGRRTGAAVPGLRAFRERFRSRAVSGVPRRVPARVLMQDAGAVPVVCGQAGGGDGGLAPRGGVIDHDVVDAILRHLAKAEAKSPRGPPGTAALSAAS